MNGYRRLTEVNRIRIKDFLSTGLSQAQIADKLKVHKSTISREIKRNSGQRGYRSKQAQGMSEERQAFRLHLRKWTLSLEKRVRVLLKRKWSPEQIASRLKLERKKTISHQRIYEFIKEDKLGGGDLWKSLRHSTKLWRKRSRSKNHRGQMRKVEKESIIFSFFEIFLHNFLTKLPFTNMKFDPIIISAAGVNRSFQ